MATTTVLSGISTALTAAGRTTPTARAAGRAALAQYEFIEQAAAPRRWMRSLRFASSRARPVLARRGRAVDNPSLTASLSSIVNARALRDPRGPLTALAIVLMSLTDVALAVQEHVGQFSQTDVELGFTLYNANCITCHGPNGDAVSGVDLRGGRFRRASTDSELSRLIQAGIPGTAMSAGAFNTTELAGLVAYIRSMHDAGTRPIKGNATRGRQLFEGKGNCTSCHRVNEQGARTAPDLSDIGAIRTLGALERSLIDPSGSMLPVNRSVRAVTRAGKLITGRRLNEDTYTVQLIDSEERLVSLAKADLREYTVLETSPMPSYKDKLASTELDDILAYLRTLKGARQP